jgi:CheY-like chemotaxis protein
MPTSVLVVDDDVAFRRLVIRLLTALGLTVVAEAGTVAAALAICAEVRPDSALVDVGLPDGDGIALAAAITALPWSTRVVLTSSEATAADDATARRAGAVAFIVKADLPDGTACQLLAGERPGLVRLGHDRRSASGHRRRRRAAARGHGPAAQ